jgi:hypothetical protein
MSATATVAKSKRVKALYLDNGVLSVKRVMDLNDVLMVTRGGKVLAWAKGRPIISRVRGLRGYTYMICPEVAYTLDESTMAEIARKGKAYLMGIFLGKLKELGAQSDGLEDLEAAKQERTALEQRVADAEKAAGDLQAAASKLNEEKIAAEARAQVEAEGRQRAEAKVETMMTKAPPPAEPSSPAVIPGIDPPVEQPPTVQKKSHHKQVPERPGAHLIEEKHPKGGKR